MSEDIRTYSRYHNPPETPREEMWEVIAARIREEGAPPAGDVLDLDDGRRSRRTWTAGSRWPRSWAAAAALLVLGIALGRATAPRGTETGAPAAPADARPSVTALEWAAFEHLERSEALLTMVRVDAREGRLDPEVAPWARSLLVETRLLLDARQVTAPTAERSEEKDMDELLGELELVLMQIVGVADAASNTDRMRTELDLAVSGMDDSEVLARIRAAMPAGLTRS